MNGEVCTTYDRLDAYCHDKENVVIARTNLCYLTKLVWVIETLHPDIERTNEPEPIQIKTETKLKKGWIRKCPHCERIIHYLGWARHRAWHREKRLAAEIN